MYKETTRMTKTNKQRNVIKEKINLGKDMSRKTHNFLNNKITSSLGITYYYALT